MKGRRPDCVRHITPRHVDAGHNLYSKQEVDDWSCLVQYCYELYKTSSQDSHISQHAEHAAE